MKGLLRDSDTTHTPYTLHNQYRHLASGHRYQSLPLKTISSFVPTSNNNKKKLFIKHVSVN